MIDVITFCWILNNVIHGLIILSIATLGTALLLTLAIHFRPRQ